MAQGTRERAILVAALAGYVAACQAAGFVFVTKAGGFGDETLVEQVLARFQ